MLTSTRVKPVYSTLFTLFNLNRELLTAESTGLIKMLELVLLWALKMIMTGGLKCKTPKHTVYFAQETCTVKDWYNWSQGRNFQGG